MIPRRLVLLAFAALLVGPLQAASPTAPKLRLPNDVRAIRYRLELTLVPSEDTFSGTIDIDLRVLRPIALIWLNSRELTIGESRLEAEGRTLPARTVTGDENFVGFAFEKPVEKGEARLHIGFTGRFNLKENYGLFHDKKGDDWYTFSQFEPIAARRAFPCFDEPSFKVPWAITLHVRREDVAVANTAAVSETEEPNGMKAVRFVETKPLPSYLVAMAAGPFDVVEVGRAGRNKTRLRILTVKGKATEARDAAEMTPPFLDLLEDYFGIPYPFNKLDQLAVSTSNFGGMENAGLITYSESILLARPEEQTIAQTRGMARTIAHEMAHLWFGDLVTLGWWDDIWLNESFATWMGAKVVDRWKPGWEGKTLVVRNRSDAMSDDTLITARKVRQGVESYDDIANSFDNITYGKGAALLSAFEAWMGKEAFQRSVHRYLTRHVYGTATSADFLAELSAEGGKVVAPAFSTFLNQPGVPLVTAEVRCGTGTRPKLLLAQSRFLPIGSKGSEARLWHIPICARYGDGTTEQRTCRLLTRASGELPLSPSCPTWLLANDGETGYYRTLYKGDLLTRLMSDGVPLSEPERSGLLLDVLAVAKAGQMPIGDALALVPRFANDKSRHVARATVDFAANLKRSLVPDELQESCARFIQAAFGKRARELGFSPKPNESEDTRLLRPQLVPFVAVDGGDPELSREAQTLARAWLADRRAVDPEVVQAVLTTAANRGDRALFDLFVSEARKTASQKERQSLLVALGSFSDPDLVKAGLDLLLSKDLDIRDSSVIFLTGFFAGAVDQPRKRELSWEFLKKNFDVLTARLPEDWAGFVFSYVVQGFCDEAHRADVASFFKERAAKLLGASHDIDQALESIHLCTALKSAQGTGVAEFLKRY